MKVDERPDDTKDSLFSSKDDAVNESDYFGSENESDLESVMGSPVFTVKQPLTSICEEVEDESVCDTSNEVIAPTQMRENSESNIYCGTCGGRQLEQSSNTIRSSSTSGNHYDS